MFDHEVIVVGGGAMGAATAWQLARDGHDVVLVERFAPGHVQGSSHGRTRIFRLAYRDPIYTELALAALPWWRTLEEECGEALLDQCGQLDHGSPLALDEVAGSLAAHGRPFERVGSAEAERRWPGIRTQDGAVFSPDGGFVAADDSVAALYRVAAQRGAEIRTHQPVRAIEVLAGGGAGVVTDAGSLTAGVVVVAAGAWAAGLVGGHVTLPPLAVTLATPSHFAVAGPSAGDPWPSVVHHVTGDGPLMFGAYAVWGPGLGMKVGLEDTDRPVDPDRRPDDVPAAAVVALTAYVQQWFPGLVAEPLDPHTCLFTSTPDEHFVLDRRGPLVVVSPCSGHGFKFVPAIGRLAAAMALSERDDAGDVARSDAWRLPRSSV